MATILPGIKTKIVLEKMKSCSCLKCHNSVNYFCLLQLLLQLLSLKIFRVQVQTLLKLVGLHHFFPMDWLLDITCSWPVRIINSWEHQEGIAFSSTLPSQTALTGTIRKDNQHGQECCTTSCPDIRGYAWIPLLHNCVS